MASETWSAILSGMAFGHGFRGKQETVAQLQKSSFLLAGSKPGIQRDQARRCIFSMVIAAGRREQRSAAYGAQGGLKCDFSCSGGVARRRGPGPAHTMGMAERCRAVATVETQPAHTSPHLAHLQTDRPRTVRIEKNRQRFNRLVSYFPPVPTGAPLPVQGSQPEVANQPW